MFVANCTGRSDGSNDLQLEVHIKTLGRHKRLLATFQQPTTCPPSRISLDSGILSDDSSSRTSTVASPTSHYASIVVHCLSLLIS
jgi:hypothetical protein